jgi:Domain of unknown function (DUF222)
MSSLASSLMQSASAVAALGDSVDDIAILDDASVVAGLGLVRDHRLALQAYELALSAQVARRSDHTLGYAGLARKNGSATPAVFIQSMTGSSIEDATRLARLGQSMVDAQDAAAGSPESPPAAPVVEAVIAGGISVAAADAIRKGLGTPDAAVTAAQLAAAAEELIARAGAGTGGLTPEQLLKAARRARNDLDLEAIERGEKQRAAIRYARVWRKDGMCGGSWALPNEDGGLEIYTTFKLLAAKKTGGPRFADASKDDTPKDTAPTTESTAPEIVVEDERPLDHVLADGFAQIFHNGLTADPTIVPGAGRAAVRVIVPVETLTNRVAGGTDANGPECNGAQSDGTECDCPDVAPTGSAILEESLSAITLAKLDEYLCEGGTVTVGFDHNGHPLDVGREQRLYTRAQRTALGVRDGGCRFPGCEKPPSWTETHHILFWARDKGPTDIANGILLCRYHHMLMHQPGWEIIRDTGQIDGNGGYWLKPPANRDPQRRLIEMPSKNPLIAAMKHAHQTEQALAS